MKTYILKIVALFAIFSSGEALAAIPPRGLVLYTEPPADYVLNLEFITLTGTSVAYATVSLPNGKKQEIPRGGIVAIINYPPEAPTESLPQDAATAMQAIKAARTKYPQFTGKLDGALTKWTNSLEVYRQRQRAAKAAMPTPTAGLTLEADGVAYSQVVLKSFDGVTVGISHSSGVARIPAIKLKPEQIVALNATSTYVRIENEKVMKSTPSQRVPATTTESRGTPQSSVKTKNSIPEPREDLSVTLAWMENRAREAKSLFPNSTSDEEAMKSANQLFPGFSELSTRDATEMLTGLNSTRRVCNIEPEVFVQAIRKIYPSFRREYSMMQAARQTADAIMQGAVASKLQEGR